MPKTILITGTSTGLGKLTAKYFAQQGWNVAATMRTPEKERELTAYDNICLFKLDVTDRAQVATAIEQASASFGPHQRDRQQRRRRLVWPARIRGREPDRLAVRRHLRIAEQAAQTEVEELWSTQTVLEQ